MATKKEEDKPKLIHLPPNTIKGLDELAKAERMHTKPYMEKVLIDHEKEKKQAK